MLARLPRPIALLFIAVLAIAMAWCFVAPATQADIAAPGQYSDVQLFRDIVKAVQDGKPYHQAAAELHRAHSYPLVPFFTMREPTLYLAAAMLGWGTLQKIAIGLMTATILVWAAAFPMKFRFAERVGITLGIALGGLIVIASPLLMALSELWVGVLLTLALGLRLHWRKKWWLPMLPIALALSMRELALPYLLLSAVFALWERRWRELAGWGVVLAAFIAFMAFHAQAEMAQVRPGDELSPGWAGMQGLRGFLMAVTYTSVWQRIWQPLALFLCLIPALGWLSLEGRNTLFAQLLLGGYALMIALFSRPDNFYWGLIVLPAWFGGYALIPRAVGQLWRAVSSR